MHFNCKFVQKYKPRRFQKPTRFVCYSTLLFLSYSLLILRPRLLRGRLAVLSLAVLSLVVLSLVVLSLAVLSLVVLCLTSHISYLISHISHLTSHIKLLKSIFPQVIQMRMHQEISDFVVA